MPRTTEQEARWQALEQQKHTAARTGRIGYAVDAGLAVPQKLVSGLALLPKLYAGMTGNGVYEPERGDDTYRMSLPPVAANTMRGLESTAETVGSLASLGGPKSVQSLYASLHRSPVTAAFVAAAPAYEIATGKGTEKWADYENAVNAYRQAQTDNAGARKLLASYSGVLGVNKKDQEQKAREFDSDVQKYTTRDKWYKKPLGAAAIGTATGAGLGYGVGSMVTKDKVNRILLSLLGGVAGGVSGHAIGQTIQDSANTSGARGSAYMNAKEQTDRLRQYMGTLNKTLEAGPPVKPQVK